MSIDPYNDVEIYEVDIEDKIVEVITLTDTPKKKMEEISPQTLTDPPTQTTTPIASTSKKENIVITDIISQNIAKDYVVEKDKERIQTKQCPYRARPWQIMTEMKQRI